MSNDPQKIIDTLFSAVGEGEALYAILDAARSMEIAFRLQSATVEYDSLYRGRKEETLWHVAPYLVRCNRDDKFFQWIIEEGWGDSWGIFLTSKESLEDLRKYFRQFLMVQLEDDKEVYFRFYDPRVLRGFLPTCNPVETKEFFGPVRCYVMEAEDPENLLTFTNSQMRMRQDAVPLSAPE